ncbi:MAG: tRNA lysidine(34) synthetase TilS, partial [Thiopseudomonas sp.]
MTTLIETLKQHLQSHTAAPGWCVALSGGLDSSVLLHALDAVRQQQACPPLRAVHIHHGLQAVADSWPQHCQALCAQLEVPLQVIHVQVDAQASTEQAARRARYAAMAGQLQAGERLLVAQHADDQSETLLLRLLRGSGVLG